MSKRPAVIALLLTLILAIGAYFILKPPAGSATTSSTMIGQGERLLTFDAATLKAITLRAGTTPQQIIERSGDGRWYWRAAASSTRRYALDDARVRALLRLLTEAKGSATPSDGKAAIHEQSAIVLGLQGPDGDTMLRMSPRALGGQVVADVATPASPTPRAAIIAEELLAVLTSPGPSAWRDTRALTVDPAAAARLTFTDGTGKAGFGLARREGRWFVTPPAPATAPADDEQVTAVLRLIDSLNIARFYDDEASTPTVQAAGLDKPSALLTLEIDDRAIDPATQKPVTSTRTAKLVFGQPADTEGTTLYATPDDGKTIFAVSALPLTKLTAPATTLIMKAATRTPPADIGALSIKAATGNRSVVLSRDSISGRWTEKLDGAASITQDPAKAEASASILSFLTRTGCDTASFNTPDDAKPTATIELLSPSGQPLDHFDALLTANGGGLILRTGGVNRTYSKPPDELVKWLAVLAR